jgi:hypothetical protein
MDLNAKTIERILVLLILMCLSATFIKFNKEKVTAVNDPAIAEEDFNKLPLAAWKDTHTRYNGKEADIIKVKYRVTNHETKLWMLNYETGKVVHEQSYHRDPWPDGRHRDFIYVWKLYDSERSDYIPPGIYEIVIGGMYPPVSSYGNISILFTV